MSILTRHAGNSSAIQLDYFSAMILKIRITNFGMPVLGSSVSVLDTS